MVNKSPEEAEDGKPRGPDTASGSECVRPAELEVELWAQSDFYHRELQRLGEEIERLGEVAAERDQALAREQSLGGERDKLLAQQQDLEDQLSKANKALSEVKKQRDQLQAARQVLEGQLHEASAKLETERDEALTRQQELESQLRKKGDDLRSMETLYGSAQARVDELAERLEAEQANAGRIAAQRDKARKQAKRNKQRLARIERSVSWRVTRPLRSLSKFMRWRR